MPTPARTSYSDHSRPAPQALREPGGIIVFDGICLLCCASFRFIHRHDKTGFFRFATAQSPPGHSILERCHLPTDHYETMVYIENGVVYQRSDAVLQILRRLPQPWPLLSLARYCPRFARDAIYNLIARNRYRIFGTRDACLIPDDAMSSRFL